MLVVDHHNNDFTDIRDIRIGPTHEELLWPLGPYLPVFLQTGPHHLPEHSMQRHLDIQFRLLREDMISSIRQSVGEICRDLDIMWAPRTHSKQHATLLEKLLSTKGGAYKTSGKSSVFFHLYTGARFAPLKAEYRNFTRRAEYWEHSKRLQHGSIIVLVLISPGQAEVFLGTIASKGADIGEYAKADANTIQLRIAFFDAKIELMALRRQPISVNASTYAVLLDNSIMFESLHPFLKTLQNVEPTSIPFSNLISYSGPLGKIPVELPRYARVPCFRYNLQCLARPGQNISNLDVNNPTAVRLARENLKRSCNLDPSQVDALLDTLTREVSLIQGPPGTGKSFTGKEILRVLFSSKIKPIGPSNYARDTSSHSPSVVIAFTNHALDHLLTSVLDSGMTTKVVRLGSRSTDERIEQYSLHKLEQLSGRGDLDRPMRREYAVMKKVEEDMTRIMNKIQLPRLTWDDAEIFLNFHYPQHADSFKEPPYWISKLFRQVIEDENENGEWTHVSNKKNTTSDLEIVGIYEFWKSGQDVAFIQPRSNPVEPGGKKGADPREAFFNELGFYGQIPSVPSGNRSLKHLTEGVHNVWLMSLQERKRIAQSWEDDMRKIAYDSNLTEFDTLRLRYKDACMVYEDVRDEFRRRLLSRTDLIACTTTGGAKLVSLLTSIGPKVLMVEEAGQVLEAHILASLVPSVEHLICIGDPKQLRPTMSTFALSMDSQSGRELFKFDRSLMERLSDAGMKMSQINVQRRMRPSISHFSRKILYPMLKDHNVVRNYPPVQGMQKDVFFFSHDNPENAEDDSVSKYNMFEVAMIRDLVLYFLKQGPYDGAGDIAVLCAYLGQLQKVRAALRDLKIAVSVDERDEEQLERAGLAGNDEIGFAQVQVARHIRIGTVDTFQGQEAKIVIISLVRNSGSFEEGEGSIGFLKSINRINVALSRAKHGLYILGNASNLRKNATWKVILDEMEDEDQIGYALPIVCPRHPLAVHSISKPGELPTFAPEGGCLRQCEFRLACGHVCPSMCHTDQDNHQRMKCNQPCVKVTCPRSHPCPLLCSDDCGECKFPVYNVRLPCGHTAESVFCYKLEDLVSIECVVPVLKSLPSCEHSAKMGCSRDRASFTCKEICGGLMTCCGRMCTSRCHECQKATREVKDIGRFPFVRTHHRAHSCERLLKCQHLCGFPCSSDHSCNPQCAGSCRQRCSHRKCEKPCWEPCPPCMEPCEWRCPH
ncbi:P-loop containing nucleoside triphosphate hydrolase protein, partial [Multifurca ochricompacta]